jgi:pullulanase/glycogen debranching enzyme
MMQYYKGLIAFRKSCETLRLHTSADRGQNVCTLDAQTNGALIAFTMTNPYTREVLFVVYNANESNVNVTLPDGVWDLYVNGEQAGATAIESGLTGQQNIDKVSCYVYKKN